MYFRTRLDEALILKLVLRDEGYSFGLESHTTNETEALNESVLS